MEKLLRLKRELEETKALLLLPRVQGNVRKVLENLQADLEKQKDFSNGVNILAPKIS